MPVTLTVYVPNIGQFEFPFNSMKEAEIARDTEISFEDKTGRIVTIPEPLQVQCVWVISSR